MLMEEKIRKHKYFHAIKMKNNHLLDSMTKTLSKSTMTAYIQYLIKNSIHFTLGIIDLDNFKRINDTYGHQIGDEILIKVSHNIMEAIPYDAVLGRFGGDEFIFVAEGLYHYEDISATVDQIYKNALRKSITLSNKEEIIVSATTGLCRYPKDAKTYDELFLLCDKCLYLGKHEGRNCFTIYVDYLHKNINISDSEKRTIGERVMDLYAVLDKSDKKSKVYNGIKYLTDDSSITGIAYISKNKIKASYEKNEDYGIPPVFPEEYLSQFEENEIIKINDYHIFEKQDEKMYQFCYENNLLSYLIYPVTISDKSFGYMVFYDSDNTRIWQDDDMALYTIFVKTLAAIAHFGNI